MAITYSTAQNMRFSEHTKKISLKIDPYYQQQKCRLGTVVSGNIRFMRIFAWVSWTGGVKWQWRCQQWQFSVISLATSSETSEIRPALLYSDTESLVGFPVISENTWPWMTLNGYFTLNSVFAPVCLEHLSLAFENNCIKTNTDRTLSAANVYLYNSSFWQYKVYAIFSGKEASNDSEVARQRTCCCCCMHHGVAEVYSLCA